MRRGCRLGVDVGSVRVGIAKSDPDGLLATPVETIQRSTEVNGVARVSELVSECGAVEVIVGLPRSLDGRERQAADLARTYARDIAISVAPIPVRMVDERLSTTSAQQAMRASGRRARAQRSVIDQAAAVIVLQAALDEERTTGKPPGRAVHLTQETGEKNNDGGGRQ